MTIEAPAAGLQVGPPSYHDVRDGFSREDFAALYGRPLPDNVPDRRGSYTVNTPVADLDHPLARALQRLLRRGARLVLRTRRDSPEWLVASSTIDDMTPRMLSMFLGVRAGRRLARLRLRVANRRRATDA